VPKLSYPTDIQEHEMAERSTTGTVDEYIAAFPPETRKVLEELRALVRATAPGVTERISYAIPGFDLHGHQLVFFAGWKKHVGLYPISARVSEAFGEELASYKSDKGSVQFPLGQPLPMELIRRIVRFRVDEITAKDG
jgi:uncharacterized protein YdhG (YjbR/CyaY superfamily)